MSWAAWGQKAAGWTPPGELPGLPRCMETRSEASSSQSPCSCLFSRVTTLGPLGRKHKCWVGLLRGLFEQEDVRLHSTVSPSCHLEDGSNVAKKREGSWVADGTVEWPHQPWAAHFWSSMLKSLPLWLSPCCQETNAIPSLYTLPLIQAGHDSPGLVYISRWQ